jgi:hypothetical protein
MYKAAAASVGMIGCGVVEAGVVAAGVQLVRLAHVSDCPMKVHTEHSLVIVVTMVWIGGATVVVGTAV